MGTCHDHTSLSFALPDQHPRLVDTGVGRQLDERLLPRLRMARWRRGTSCRCRELRCEPKSVPCAPPFRKSRRQKVAAAGSTEPLATAPCPAILPPTSAAASATRALRPIDWHEKPVIPPLENISGSHLPAGRPSAGRWRTERAAPCYMSLRESTVP